MCTGDRTVKFATCLLRDHLEIFIPFLVKLVSPHLPSLPITFLLNEIGCLFTPSKTAVKSENIKLLKLLKTTTTMLRALE